MRRLARPTAPTFRNAIWQVLHETWVDDEPLPMHADAILAMPEMQEIRRVLRGMFTTRKHLPLSEAQQGDMHDFGLPANVIAWLVPA